MKKIMILFGMVVSLMSLTACGITEELDQVKTNLNDVQTSLTEQKALYKQLKIAISTLTDDFESDLKKSKGASLDPEGDSKTFKNVEERKQLLATLTDENKNLMSLKDNLVSLNKKNSLDVDHAKLKLIINSLDILNSNFDSLKAYADVNFSQEDDFYSHLPKNIEDQLSLIERSYGAIDLIADEAKANIAYTSKLIKDFLATAPKTPELQREK